MNLPSELQGKIAASLDAATLVNLRLTNSSLYTTVADAPRMTFHDWMTINSQYETRVRRSRRVPLSLLCTKCSRLKPANGFPDSEVKRAVSSGRSCAECVIIRKKGRPGNIIIGGLSFFGCVGCIKVMPLTEEEIKPNGRRHWLRRCKDCQPALDSPIINNYHKVRRGNSSRWIR